MMAKMTPPSKFGTQAPDRPPTLPALRLVAAPAGPRRVAKILVLLLLLAVVAMLVMPWQQSVRGTGRVVAYAPLERQQVIKAPIAGRIVRWGEGIIEGARVTEGQFLLEIRDNAPELLERLQEQLDAARQELDAGELMAKNYNDTAEAFEIAQNSAVEAANKQVEMAVKKVEAQRQGSAAAKAARDQSLANQKRQKDLYDDGLAAELVYEIAERQLQVDEAEVKQAEAYVESAQRELESKRAEAIQKSEEAKAKTDNARAVHQKALGEVALARNKLADAKVNLARQKSQVVEAPRDGTIFRLLANQGGEWVKATDPLLILVPETAKRAVEIWLSGNDAPLVTQGRHVRLQFEGWPAVQFAGWPSIAVGTFGGEVAVVDPTDNGLGQFRILVLPEEGGQPWPSNRFLRQGVRANGWVLLNQVKLGYELWRQLNGFPPVISMDEPKEMSGSSGGAATNTKSK